MLGVRRGCCCSAGADPGCAPCREEWLAPSAVSWPGARPPRCSPPRARGCWPRATCWASTTSVLLCTRRGSSTRPGKGRGRAGREVTPAERHSPRACHGWAVWHQTQHLRQHLQFWAAPEWPARDVDNINPHKKNPQTNQNQHC